MRLPPALTAVDSTEAVSLLRRYYDRPADALDGFSGAAFDTWDSTGTRAAHVGRFTADDLADVSLLGVEVRGRAAVMLLDTQADSFAKLLGEVGPDRDLADVDAPIADESAESRLFFALAALPRVGPTTASKLYARKRPRMRPIYDTVVAEVTGTRTSLWEPFRKALRADDKALHAKLLRLRIAANLPEDVSALRVLDVVCWMAGKGYGTS